MIESVTYDLIKREGLLEGLEKGRQEGMEKGIEKGIERGRLEGLWSGLLEAIAFGLDLRFGPSGLRLLPEISQIHDLNRLRAIQDRLKTAQSPEELRLSYQPA
jgi:predicted transposase YdaD